MSRSSSGIFVPRRHWPFPSTSSRWLRDKRDFLHTSKSNPRFSVWCQCWQSPFTSPRWRWIGVCLFTVSKNFEPNRCNLMTRPYQVTVESESLLFRVIGEWELRFVCGCHHGQGSITSRHRYSRWPPSYVQMRKRGRVCLTHGPSRESTRITDTPDVPWGLHSWYPQIL